MKILFICFICLFNFLSYSKDFNENYFDNLPFREGEVLKYKIKWNFIPVGYFQAEVKELTTYSGKQVWHFVTKARTNAFADAVYKVRDKIESFVSVDLSKSYLYLSDTHEGNYKRKQKLTFFWDKLKLHYLKNDTEDLGMVDIIANSLDPLAMFYYIRIQDWSNKKEVLFRISDGKVSIESKLKIIKRVTIKVLGKKYDTYLVEPELDAVRGIFKKKKGAKLKIWVTADSRKIPVKISSKVVVGSFIAELIDYMP